MSLLSLSPPPPPPRPYSSPTSPSLSADEDLSNMYLTAKEQHAPRSLTDHDEAEVLMGT